MHIDCSRSLILVDLSPTIVSHYGAELSFNWDNFGCLVSDSESLIQSQTQ